MGYATATLANATAILTITQATALTGTVENRTATLNILKGGLSMDYKIVFGSSVISNNALLNNIRVDGTAIEFFNKNTFSYPYYYPYTQSAQPVVT